MAIDGVDGLLTEVAKFASCDCSKARLRELPDSFAIAIEEFTLQKGASLSSGYKLGPLDPLRSLKLYYMNY